MVASSKRVPIGFVAYHPGQQFYERLLLLAELGYVTYVFDNSPEDQRTAAVSKSLNSVRYLTAGKNVGLGFSLSVIAAMASYDRHEMLLFLDQDTSFTEKTIRFIQDVADRDCDLMKASYVAVVFDGRAKDGLLTDQPLEDVMLVISSGSLFCLRNLAKIGWHNETYFVDGVDYELCLRARAKGFRIGKCAGADDFDHVSEQPDRLFCIFGREYPVRRYSGARVRDSLGAYLRLILVSLRRLDLPAATALTKSLLIYVFGQVLALLAIRRGPISLDS